VLSVEGVGARQAKYRKLTRFHPRNWDVSVEMRREGATWE